MLARARSAIASKPSGSLLMYDRVLDESQVTACMHKPRKGILGSQRPFETVLPVWYCLNLASSNLFGAKSQILKFKILTDSSI